VCLRCDGESIDDGPVGIGVEGVGGNGAVDGPQRHSSKGKQVVGGDGAFSGGYWSMGSGSKESRYSGVLSRGGWLWWGELFKRRIDESGGSRPPVYQ